MKRTDSVHSEGAALTFDIQGAGVPLLLIPGAGGDGAVYARIAPLLAAHFTVITYDRRCTGRSSGNVATDLNMAQQARDAVAVLRAAGHEQGIIFGNSGGANIALQVTADHPDRVLLLVGHEPPLMNLLPDAQQQQAFAEQVYQTFDTQGAPAAMRLFAGSLVGVTRPGPPPAATAGPGTMNTLNGGEPGRSTPPNGGGLGQAKDQSFFFGREYRNITFAAPNLAAIRDAQIPAVILVGALSTGAAYARTVPIIAERLGCPWDTVPGNHLAFLFTPEPFAQALQAVITRLLAAQPVG